MARTNWCSVPVCEQECQEILNGLTPFLCSCKDGYILNDDKKTCREKEVASGCRRTDCPTENGGCSEEQCFCNIGYRLSDANMCQPTVTDWCAVASCEQGCNVTSDRSWFTCSCRDGCVLNIDKTTCRVGECNRKDCPTENGGCRMGECNRKDCPTENGGCRMGLCFCDDGYELSEFEDQRCVLPRSKDEETPGSTDSTLAIGLGVGLGVLALIVVAVACYLYKKGQSSGIADDNRYVRPDSAPGTTASENPSWASV
ncbi:matrilin-2-like [Littorina saxatilis]|uniref:matrilin-2-like n=1 Tax=Littorina saxatilis TaxID=31220 RepID=UPI0038B4A66F